MSVSDDLETLHSSLVSRPVWDREAMDALERVERHVKWLAEKLQAMCPHASKGEVGGGKVACWDCLLPLDPATGAPL